MCGIAGFTGHHDRRTLDAMVEAIRHRGPDESGIWEGEGVSLGMRRLSIIDVAGGRQPMFNEDGRVACVFNGEIYNHVELQKKLVDQGHRFRSDHSDTETIVHLYEQHGLEFLQHLNGMFAIALWDARYRRLVLARDRVGIKPLYFTRVSGGIAFASEIKALLRHGEASRDPDFESLYHYFSFKNVPSPATAYANISQLRPGEYATFGEGSFKRTQWWSISFADQRPSAEEDAAAEIRSLLEDSVRMQMRADVPFGAFLSGGVDSSSVVALMSRISGAKIKTFSLTYGSEIDHKSEDQRFARQVADLYSTDHHEYVLSADEVVDSVEPVLEAFDEPFSGVTSTFFLTKLIARHVKVALSGDGADELFGSYLSHRLAQPLEARRRLQRENRTASPTDLDLLKPFEHRQDYLDELLAIDDEAERRMSLHLWGDSGKASLISDRFRALSNGVATRNIVADILARAGTTDPLNRALFYDFESLLPDQVLTFVDRLSMAHSVEVRPPFLDHRLVELAAALPGSMKIRNGREKHILKEAVRGLIPDAILNRKKEGFVLPIDKWLLNELRPRVEAALRPERLRAHGLLMPGKIARMLAEHFAGTANHGPRIWNVFMFQMWWEKTYGAC